MPKIISESVSEEMVYCYIGKEDRDRYRRERFEGLVILIKSMFWQGYHANRWSALAIKLAVSKETHACIPLISCVIACMSN